MNPDHHSQAPTDADGARRAAASRRRRVAPRHWSVTPHIAQRRRVQAQPALALT